MATVESRGSRSASGAERKGRRGGGAARKRSGRATPMTMAGFAEAIVRQYQEKGSSHVTLWRVRLVFSLLADGAGVRSAAELERADIIPRFDEALAAKWKRGSIQWRGTTAFFHRILRLGCKLGTLHSIPELSPITHAKSERSTAPRDAMFTSCSGR